MSLRLSLTFLSLLPFLSIGAIAVTAQRAGQSPHPYAWLEDVHGVKPLAWAAERNKKQKIADAFARPTRRYQKNYDSVLQVLDAPDRIPSGSLRHGFVYNFWQDAKNPKGVWRRTSIADYANPAPHWDILLDIDALAKSEKENWVFEGSECAPKETRCLIRLSRGGGDAVVVREYDLKAKKSATDGVFLDRSAKATPPISMTIRCCSPPISGKAA